MVEELLRSRFSTAPEKLKESLRECGMLKEVPKGTILYYPGAVCEFVPLVLEGKVKVYVVSESGREVSLYNVEKHETCMLTNLSILRKKPYPAYATTGEDSRILLIEEGMARHLFDNFSTWRDFVLDMFVKDGWLLADRLSEVISRRVDRRLIDYLLSRASNEGTLNTTHEEIARDIGTAREVVSRLLKRFESQELVELKRGHIFLKNREGLKALLEE